jgi:hypothetical protein
LEGNDEDLLHHMLSIPLTPSLESKFYQAVKASLHQNSIQLVTQFLDISPSVITERVDHLLCLIAESKQLDQSKVQFFVELNTTVKGKQRYK